MSKLDAKLEKLIRRYYDDCKRIAMATSIDINEGLKEKIARRNRLEKDYIKWFEYYFPNYAKYPSATFHKKLANLIINNKNIRLLAEMFRSAAKSTHIDMGIPLYLYLVLGELNFLLLVGETETKAKRLLSGIQAQLAYNNRIINDYGKRMGSGDWAGGDFSTSDGKRFMSLGFGQNPRGAREEAERPDYIVVDDVDSKKHVNNDRMMREGVDFIMEDIWGCFDAASGGRERFVFANNNFHSNSITNRLKKQFKEAEKNNDSDTVYKVLTVNAVNNIKEFKPSWIGKTSSKYWKDKFASMPFRSFMREYMNTHIADGAIFKHQDLQFVKPLNLGKYDSLCFYGDLSYKANADYKAMILVGKVGKHYHVLLTYLQQKSRADCAAWLYDMHELHNLHKYNIRYEIEGLFAMDEFVNDFDTEAEQRGVATIPVIASKRPKGDKYDRVESLTGYWERGWWFFSEKDKTKDQQTLIDQFMAFEKGSKAHDDGPDACHGALAHLNRDTRKHSANYKFEMRTSMKY